MNGERTSEHHARATDPLLNRLAGVARRMVVRFTAGAIWELAGFRALGERVRAEVFQGIGIWARPPADAAVDAVVVNQGGADHPIVVALRDARTRKAVADALGVDETMLHNSLAVVYVRNNSTVEVRTVGGTAVALAKYSDLQALRDWVAAQFASPGGHSHSALGAPPTLGAGGPTQYIGDPPDPSPTTCLKGE